MGYYNLLLSVPMGRAPLWVDAYRTSGRFDALTSFAFSVSLGLQMELRLYSRHDT